MPNRLASETSQYLLQHAGNPVDWYPWGDDAFDAARRLDRPVFLSIGYSACHWCHVMEEESFSDPAVAALLNEHFVSIKVDREERPDVDHIYMAAVQILSQRGGWPLTVFLTPERQPFYGGTYFPKEDRFGMPSFSKVLGGIRSAWKTRRHDLDATAQQLTRSITTYFAQRTAPGPISFLDFATVLTRFCDAVVPSWDAAHGGLGEAPKFFHTEALRLLLRKAQYFDDGAARNIVRQTLDHMGRGGIRDQLAGGFHRYSTDREWLAPHFEKMLYDNALLATSYIEAFTLTREASLAGVARTTLDFLSHSLRSPEGGFYSTMDADSEGVEGKFYVWQSDAIDKILDHDEAALFREFYGVRDGGNWEGSNILHVPIPFHEFAKRRGLEEERLDAILERDRRKLLLERNRRIPPNKDEKIIASWNGMAIEAFALAGWVLGDPEYIHVAESAADFLCRELLTTRRLGHSFCRGKIVAHGLLDDHAFLMNGLVELFLVTSQARWLEAVHLLSQHMLGHFWDADSSQFFYTSRHDTGMITRPVEVNDGATPAASAIATLAFAKAGLLIGESKLLSVAESALGSASEGIQKNPEAYGSWVLAADFLIHNPRVLAVVFGDNPDENEAILAALRSRPRNNQLVLTGAVKGTPLEGKQSVEGKPTLFVCNQRFCEPPVTGFDAIDRRLLELAGASKCKAT